MGPAAWVLAAEETAVAASNGMEPSCREFGAIRRPPRDPILHSSGRCRSRPCRTGSGRRSGTGPPGRRTIPPTCRRRRWRTRSQSAIPSRPRIGAPTYWSDGVGDWAACLAGGVSEPRELDPATGLRGNSRTFRGHFRESTGRRIGPDRRSPTGRIVTRCAAESPLVALAVREARGQEAVELGCDGPVETVPDDARTGVSEAAHGRLDAG